MESDAAPTGEFVFPEMDLVIFGPGSTARLGTELERLGCRRVLLVTTSSLAGRGSVGQRVRDLVGDALVGEFSAVRQHAPASGVVGLTAEAERVNADAFVSLGGGSVIDTAKASALALARDTGTFPQHIALSTTLSASEFSPLFGVTDEATKVKAGGNSPFVVPQVAILDAELAEETPDWLWLASGVRALDHAVETVYAPNHQPATDAAALEAIHLLFEHLPRSVGPDRSLLHRQQCQIAAWLSFIGVNNITLGLSHILGREIGPRYDIPHGYTSAILLPHVMTFLLPETAARQSRIAEAMNATGAGEASNAVSSFIRGLGLPQRLRDVGVPEADLPELADGRDDVLHILESAW